MISKSGEGGVRRAASLTESKKKAKPAGFVQERQESADSGTFKARSVHELSLEIALSTVTSLPTLSCSRSPLSKQSLKRRTRVTAA